MIKNVLYITYDGLTDNLGQSQVLPYLVGLSEKGYRITILSCEKEHRFKEQKSRIEQIVAAHALVWVPIAYTARPPVLSTVWDIWQLFRQAKKIHRQTPLAIVHCRSYITALVGLFLKKKYGVKFVFDMRGFWADERVEGGIWKVNNPLFKLIYRYFKKKEGEFFSQADYTVSLTENGKSVIHGFSHVWHQPIPIEVIPCCVDIDHFNPDKVLVADSEHWRTHLQLPASSFVLTYLGAIGTWYMLEEMMHFFQRLYMQKSDAIFLFITSEPKEEIIAMANRYQVPLSQIRVQYAKRQELPALLSLSTMSIFFIKPVFSKKASSPTKQGEIMSMGIPIICNSGVGDTDRIIREAEAGVIVSDFSIQAYDTIVKEIDQWRMINKERIRQGAERFYALEQGILRYEKIYRKILEK